MGLGSDWGPGSRGSRTGQRGGLSVFLWLLQNFYEEGLRAPICSQRKPHRISHLVQQACCYCKGG